MSLGTHRDQVERVEGLLASVQDVVATLQKLGSELEHEVAQALYRDIGTGGSEQATLELENTRLKHALEGRSVIEQAKGMIMAGQGGSEQDAFAVLTRISRRENRSPRDVAAGIIQTGSRAARQRADGAPAHNHDAPADDAAAVTDLDRVTDLDDVIELDVGSESLKHRWKLTSPSHASNRRDAPRFRDSNL